MKEAKRSTFSGRLGFVLAAAGSAVGLGNLWRFPYLAAKYGGGIFLLIYIILAVTFGFTLMITEIAIGKKHTEAPWKHTVCSIKNGNGWARFQHLCRLSFFRITVLSADG